MSLTTHRGILDRKVRIAIYMVSGKIGANAITNFPVSDAFSQCDDFSCHVGAWNQIVGYYPIKLIESAGS